ncbi:MAG: hypothetical protein R2695_18990 [Acidimicrobiales bacterium]
MHLVMVPPHIEEWQAEGIGFAISGWLQIGLAASSSPDRSAGCSGRPSQSIWR